MARQTAELGPYIAKCFPQIYGPIDNVFNEKNPQRTPTLKSNRANRIILYPGSFNPPHQGHRALLCHAFHSCQDINVIGAFILPGGHTAIEVKVAREGSHTAFTNEERIRLWKSCLPDWCWVYSGQVRDFKSFSLQLFELIKRDGFQVQFVMLMGPDHIHQWSRPTRNRWHCHEVVISDISRAPEFLTWTNTLQRFDRYTPWKTVPHSGETEGRKIRSVVHNSIDFFAPAPVVQMLLERGN
jgi:nicotinic acid mononucleotide adenylyltransferase